MGLFDNAWRFVTDSEVVMDWVGVDPLHQVVTRDEAMDLIPWLSVRWRTSPLIRVIICGGMIKDWR